MTEIFLKVAGFIICIKLLPSEIPGQVNHFLLLIQNLCHGFIVQKPQKKIDYTIIINYRNTYRFYIDSKIGSSFIEMYTQSSGNSIQTYYHLSQFQLQLVLRKAVQDLLADGSGFICHGSASLIEDKVVLFLGRSGAGKSTIVNLLKSVYRPLSDDMFIIKRESGEFIFYQIPWPEKNNYGGKEPVGLSIMRIYFLKKSKIYKKVKISNELIVSKKFLEQIFTNFEQQPDQIRTAMQFINANKNFFELFFSLKNPEALFDLGLAA